MRPSACALDKSWREIKTCSYSRMCTPFFVPAHFIGQVLIPSAPAHERLRGKIDPREERPVYTDWPRDQAAARVLHAAPQSCPEHAAGRCGDGRDLVEITEQTVSGM